MPLCVLVCHCKYITVKRSWQLPSSVLYFFFQMLNRCSSSSSACILKTFLQFHQYIYTYICTKWLRMNANGESNIKIVNLLWAYYMKVLIPRGYFLSHVSSSLFASLNLHSSLSFYYLNEVQTQMDFLYNSLMANALWLWIQMLPFMNASARDYNKAFFTFNQLKVLWIYWAEWDSRL